MENWTPIDSRRLRMVSGGKLSTRSFLGLAMSYEYDAVGNRTSRTDYNNQTTAYSYDNLNRLATVTYPDTTTVAYGYDALSRLTSATNENGMVSFAYDNRGRVNTTTDAF